MATFYLDFKDGNDANDGTSFANRWKTITSGATAARIAPGDIIRVIASPAPTLLDNSASWTDLSATVTLSGAVTANIDLCETAWTASANVTCNTSATRREGSLATTHAIAAGFTTGLISYKALGGATDFSSYQQVSLWIRATAAVAASTLTLTLCSDAAGATPVNTIALPAIPAANRWQVVTVDTGGALGASIQSVALNALLDPGTPTIYLDNILACKASSSADSLTLNSLVGKEHNLYWTASAAHAANVIRKPTPANRNGYCYKVTAGGGGNSGGSEPTWPAAIGNTVVDGDLTWTCEGLEETWWAIQSINGTTVKLDNDTETTIAATRGYVGTTESVATYKFQPITLGPSAGASSTYGTVQDSGTASARIQFVGGWNRTDMSTQTGESWQDGQNGNGIFVDASSKSNITFNNFGFTRFNTAYSSNASTGFDFRNFHGCSMQSNFVGTAGNSGVSFYGVRVVGAAATGLTTSTGSRGVIQAYGYDSGSGSSFTPASSSKMSYKIRDIWGRNSAGYGLNWQAASPVHVYGLVARNNSLGSLNAPDSNVYLYNSLLADSTEVVPGTAREDWHVFSHNHDQVVGAHKIITDSGTMQTATDQRHTASGYSWKFNPTSTTVRTAAYPLHLSVAKIACTASVAVNVRIWTRRDSTNIKGQLFLLGGQIAGVGLDVTVACEPAINTWVQSDPLTFTPTADGVVEVLFRVWDETGTTNSYWVDDLSLS